jgi:hypothetical protein
MRVVPSSLAVQVTVRDGNAKRYSELRVASLYLHSFV